jgi:single-strand DNA-binding protein
VDVELFGRVAEIAGEYLRKGRPVFIEGRLKLDTWDDKQSGQKRSKMRVVGEQLQLLGSRDGAPQGGPAGGRSEYSGESRPAQRSAPRPSSPPPRPPADPDLDASDDDIPF